MHICNLASGYLRVGYFRWKHARLVQKRLRDRDFQAAIEPFPNVLIAPGQSRNNAAPFQSRLL